MSRMLRSPKPTRKTRARSTPRLALLALEDRTAPAVFTVTTTADSGTGSLRDAITQANALAGIDDIVFDPAVFSTAQKISLATALPNISQGTNLLGPGANLLTVTRDAAATIRIFNFTATGTTPSVVKGMTLTGGNIAADGGAILMSGFVTIDSCVITNNAPTGAFDGGAIRVNSGAFLRVVNSTISGNTARSGGAVYFYSGGSLLVENSTISGNTSTGTGASYYQGGGAVYWFGTVSASPPAGFTPSTLVIRNSTISGNTTSGSGGGLQLDPLTGTLLVQNSIITGNTSTLTASGYGGGGIGRTSGTGTIIIDSSIVSGNTNANGPDILSAGTVNVNFSAVGNATGFTLTGGNNIAFGTDLKLGALASNGGPNKTHLPASDSPLVNAGKNNANLITDGRGPGFYRVFGTAPDIGPVEVQPAGLPQAALKAPDVTTAGATSYTFTVTYSDDVAIKAASVVGNNAAVRVTGPSGFDAPASYVSIDNNTDGTPRTVTYSVTPPGGSWDGPDPGLYTVSVVGNQVSDTASNFIPNATIGTFGVVYAGTFTVTKNSDSGAGSLRDAIDRSNAAVAADKIVFDPAAFATPQTITLSTGELLLTDSTTIVGPGAANLTISGNNASRIFNLAGAKTFDLSGMKITGGLAPSGLDGGGIFVATAASVLLLDRVEISGNKTQNSGDGGGIGVNGASFIRVTNSTISGNTAQGTAGAGGGIYFFSGGGLLMQNTTVSGNAAQTTAAGDGGGGIYFFGTANTAPPAGFGFTAGKLVIQNSTFSGNTSASGGGAIIVDSFTGDLLVQNSTITGNTAANTATNQGGGGIFRSSGTGTITVDSTIITGNTNANGPAIYVAATTGAVTVNFSAIDNLTGFSLTGSNNLSTANSTVAALGLQPLANNGGPNQTHAISKTSPARDAGSNVAGLTTDQRGLPFSRAFGTPDIGAFEYQPPAVSINQGKTQSDPTNVGPIVFDVLFSEAVTGFDAADIAFTGSTAPGTLVATVSGTGPAYSVSVSGMTGSGLVVTSIPANAATATATGEQSQASFSSDNSVTYDVTPPTAILATTAQDPTNKTIPVTVTFSEPVSGFTASDLTVTNGAVANFAGSGAAFTFDLTPAGQGLVSVVLPSGTVADAANNQNAVDSNTLSRTFDSVAPTVTINQATGQADPSKVSNKPIDFTVVFSEPVVGFDTADITISGTAGATTAAITGTGPTYTVTISGMVSPGTVVVTIPAGAVADPAGNSSAASTSTDNTVTYDPPVPSVTVEQAATQGDPTNLATVFFTATFNQDVLGFDASDVVLGGTAKPTTVVISGTGPEYTLAVSGMSDQGTITASIPANKVTSVANGLSNPASTSVDNTITWDTIAPTVVLATTAPLLTNVSPIPVTVAFSETAVGFTLGDLTLVNATAANLTGSGKSFAFDLVPSGQGTVSVSLAAGVATDPAGNANTASNLLSRQFDNVAPVPTITLGPGLADPTNLSPIVFSVVFSEPVTGFDKADIVLGGTAKAKTATVTGSGTTYSVSVSGMTTPGTVLVSTRAAAAVDPTGNTSPLTGPFTVVFDDVAPTVTVGLAANQANQTNTSPVRFLLTFSEPVVAPLAAAMSTSLSTVNPGLTLTVNPLTNAVYEVEVSNVSGTGNVVLTVPTGVTTDLAGNPSKAPTLTGNTVSFDDVRPSVTVAPATGQPNPTFLNPMKFAVSFSEVVTGFTAADVVIGGTALPTSATVTGSGKSYVVSVGGMTRRGTVTVTVPDGAAADGFGNTSTVGTAPTQTYSPTGGGVPIGSEVQLTVTGAGPGGGPHVQVYNADGTTRFSFFAYSPTFTGGVRVATGDANGDGTEDIITAAGPGGGPHVKVFDGVTGKELWGFFAYDPAFTGGVQLATADINVDGIIEIVTAAGAGGGPHVKIVDMFTGTVRQSFFAYDPAFTGGVNLAVADVTGDGVTDVVTGPGAGPGSDGKVKVFDGTNAKLVASFLPAIGSLTSGYTVAAGDFLGDAAGEIAVAPATGSGGVQVYSTVGTLLQTLSIPSGFESANGLRLANGTRQPNSTHATLLVAPGPGAAAKVRRFGDADLTFLDEFSPYGPSFLGGVYVA